MSTNYYNVRKGFVRANPIDNTPFDQSLDEPTYLTFKLEFDFDDIYNRLTNETTYDELPQALLQMPSDSEGTYPDELKPEQFSNLVKDMSKVLKGTGHPEFTTVKNYTKNNFGKDRRYSAIDYLLSRNEDYRAYLLSLFMQGLYALQTQYQFYFQEISGLDSLKGNSPDKGWKIGKEGKIKVKCLEGIDQKIAYLKSLYKAIAWDDKYQRWILPNIYRYFKVNIYISEIRTFHVSSLRDNDSSYFFGIGEDAALEGINNVADRVLKRIANITKGAINSAVNIDSEVLELLSSAVPISCYRCSMCDFDVTDHLYQDNYSINNDNMEENTFTIRVKQCEVFNHWNIVKNLFIKNFYSARERKYGAGDSDYNFIGNGFKNSDWFNNTQFLSETDKYHSYTSSISMGPLIEAYQDSIKSAMNTDNVVDLAASLYNIIKSSVSEYKAEKDSYTTLSTAANPSRNRIKEINSMTAILSEVIGSAAVARNDTEREALKLLRNTGKSLSEMKDIDSSLRDRLLNLNMDTSMNNIIHGINDISIYNNIDHKESIEKFEKLNYNIDRILVDSSNYYNMIKSQITDISVKYSDKRTDQISSIPIYENKKKEIINDVSYYDVSIIPEISSVKIKENITKENIPDISLYSKGGQFSKINAFKTFHNINKDKNLNDVSLYGNIKYDGLSDISVRSNEAAENDIHDFKKFNSSSDKKLKNIRLYGNETNNNLNNNNIIDISYSNIDKNHGNDIIKIHMADNKKPEDISINLIRPDISGKDSMISGIKPNDNKNPENDSISSMGEIPDDYEQSGISDISYYRADNKDKIIHEIKDNEKAAGKQVSSDLEISGKEARQEYINDISYNNTYRNTGSIGSFKNEGIAITPKTIKDTSVIITGKSENMAYIEADGVISNSENLSSVEGNGMPEKAGDDILAAVNIDENIKSSDKIDMVRPLSYEDRNNSIAETDYSGIPATNEKNIKPVKYTGNEKMDQPVKKLHIYSGEHDLNKINIPDMHEKKSSVEKIREIMVSGDISPERKINKNNIKIYGNETPEDNKIETFKIPDNAGKQSGIETPDVVESKINENLENPSMESNKTNINNKMETMDKFNGSPANDEITGLKEPGLNSGSSQIKSISFYSAPDDNKIKPVSEDFINGFSGKGFKSPDFGKPVIPENKNNIGNMMDDFHGDRKIREIEAVDIFPAGQENRITEAEPAENYKNDQIADVEYK